MQCRNCGAEIADKAIVCYRCGAGTTDPVRRAVPIKPKRTPLVDYVMIAVLMAVAAYFTLAARTAEHSDYFTLAAGLCGGAAVVLLFRRILSR
jgi:hypothetical protein